MTESDAEENLYNFDEEFNRPKRKSSQNPPANIKKRKEKEIEKNQLKEKKSKQHKPLNNVATQRDLQLDQDSIVAGELAMIYEFDEL